MVNRVWLICCGSWCPSNVSKWYTISALVAITFAPTPAAWPGPTSPDDVATPPSDGLTVLFEEPLEAE
jgi:hypothetical protein